MAAQPERNSWGKQSKLMQTYKTVCYGVGVLPLGKYIKSTPQFFSPKIQKLIEFVLKTGEGMFGQTEYQSSKLTDEISKEELSDSSPNSHANYLKRLRSPMPHLEFCTFPFTPLRHAVHTHFMACGTFCLEEGKRSILVVFLLIKSK